MSILGTRVTRREDAALLTGDSRYVADVRLEGDAHVVFVRSTEAHALITGVDSAEAAEMPGVLRVVTGDQLGMPPRMPLMPTIDRGFARPGLAVGRVRFVGEPVVAVVAETVTEAMDAAEAVWIDYESLPVVLDPTVAADSDILLFPDVGTNVMATNPVNTDDDVLADSAVVVRRTIRNHRMATAPMEPRVIAASWSDGRMTIDASTQGAFGLRAAVAAMLDVDESDVRVRFKDVGGGFGAKGSPNAEEMVVVWLAREIGRPLRWAETRTENLMAMGHGRGQVHDIAIGADADGHISGLEISLVQDGGAYPGIATVLPRLTLLMAVGSYDISKVKVEAKTVATNTNSVGAYRGAGRPEAAYAIERMIDELAAELSIDPAELRRRNFIQPSDFPLTTVTGAPYDSGDYEGTLDAALAEVGYDDVRAEQDARRRGDSTKMLGIGMATYVEVTAGNPTSDRADLELMPDGRMVLKTGSAPQGQGHLTTWAMIAADHLGMSPDDIVVESGDTDAVPEAPIVGGSRSVQGLGSTVGEAADELVSVARDRAASLLEAAVEDITFDADHGSFHVVGTPAVSVGWDRLAATVAEDPLAVEHVSEPRQGSFPFGAHVAVVEVDTETGRVALDRFVAVDDCGTIVNALLVEGQVHGGVAAGIGHAMFEEVVYDDAGNPLTTNLGDYAMPSAAELPFFERVAHETPSPSNPLGAKGIGESGTIGAMPAVVNAVMDALRPLGVVHIDTPLSPQRVWEALEVARSVG